jgi:hypothetical protein
VGDIFTVYQTKLSPTDAFRRILRFAGNKIKLSTFNGGHKAGGSTFGHGQAEVTGGQQSSVNDASFLE